MALLASDVGNREYVGAMDPDAVMYAEFHMVAVKQPFESEKQGREIWKDVLYCKYGPSGNTLLQNDVPSSDYHKLRFHRQWALYENAHGADAKLVGTPVSQWPILSPADAENLKSAKFYTVENIAAASDLQLQSLGMGIAGMSGYVLRVKANAFLQLANDSALPQKQASDIEALKKQVADLTALLTVKPVPEPVKKEKKTKKEWTPEMRAAAGARLKAAREAKQKAK